MKKKIFVKYFVGFFRKLTFLCAADVVRPAEVGTKNQDDQEIQKDYFRIRYELAAFEYAPAKTRSEVFIQNRKTLLD